MSWIQLLILSFVQGATEFLPVSSSGHLILMPRLFGWQEQGIEMDVALHVGTLCAVFLYFWQDVRPMITSTWSWIWSGFSFKNYNNHVQLAMCIVVGTIPAVIIGFILKRSGIDLVRQVWVIGFTSIIFGILLYLSDRLGRQDLSIRRMSQGNAFLIGIGQALALIPGTSRSGACITAALALGYDRVSAARFSFLLSIPSILGAATLTFIDVLKGPPLAFALGDFILGIFFSMVAGLMAISFMLYFLTRYRLTIFMVYRLILGTAILLLM